MPSGSFGLKLPDAKVERESISVTRVSFVQKGISVLSPFLIIKSII